LYGGHTLAELLGLTEPFVVSDATVRASPVNMTGIQGSPVYQFYTVPSPFDSARWPTYFRPVVSLSKKSTDAEWGRMAEVVHDYVHRYSNVKGVIHVAATNQIDRIARGIRGCPDCRGRLLYPAGRRNKGRTENRGELLRRFRLAGPGTWLLHYSMGEGEDFTGDLGRIQLITKLPRPDLSDKLTRLRMEEPDYGETIILDGSFRRLWQWHKDLAPDWFKDVLVYR